MIALMAWMGAASGIDIGWKTTIAAICGACIILLYAASSTCHAMTCPPAKRVLHGVGNAWLLIGGVLYILGCVFYLWKSSPYGHMVWHLFVLAGTICHFFCIFWRVM